MSRTVLALEIRNAVDAAFVRADTFVNHSVQAAAQEGISRLQAHNARVRAMEMLGAMRKGIMRGRYKNVPRMYLEPAWEGLLPVATSWPIFQLYAALQLLAAFIHQNAQKPRIQPEDVIRAFGLVGDAKQRGAEANVQFIYDDVTPLARRAILTCTELPDVGIHPVSARILNTGNRQGRIWFDGEHLGPTMLTPPALFWDDPSGRWDANEP